MSAGWVRTGDGNGALLLAILADFAGALPLVFKTWRNPETENIAEYTGNFVAAMLKNKP